MKIHNKNVLLTGASRGIGVMMAHYLARKGANVTITSREASIERLKLVAEALKKYETQIFMVTGDLRSAEERANLVEESIREMGSIDILINNAGLEYTATFENTSPEVVDEMVDTNLVAPIELARLVLPSMIKSGSGHIVNVASLAGRVPLVYNSIYSATKSGLITWTKTVADEYEEQNIGFSVVCPGFISTTGMHARHGTKAPFIASEVTPEKVAEEVINAIEKNRLEVLVNSKPVRPLLGLWEWFPGIKKMVYKHTGLMDFMEKVKDREESMRAAY